jgi:FdhD protein
MHCDAAPASPESLSVLEFPDGTLVARWLCTPERVTDLALGWLFGEGLIDGPADVARFETISPGRERVWLRDEEQVRDTLSRRASRTGPASSAVLAALDSSSELPRHGGTEASSPSRDPVLEATLARPAHLRELFGEMFERTYLKKAHGGGLHTGAHVIDGILRDVVEDVSRSAVVDKLVGASLKEASLGPSSLFLLSGRISATIASKLARAGVGAAATISVPTSLAVEIAAREGISILGRARRETPYRYGAV